MSKTIRRKNAYNKHLYVDYWFGDFVNQYYKPKHTSKKVRSAWYHSDNYKPYDSAILHALKIVSKRAMRASVKMQMNKVYKTFDYDELDVYHNEGKEITMWHFD